MKVGRKKSEYMCVNKREKGEHVRSRDHKDKYVKYRGSTIQSNGHYPRQVRRECRFDVCFGDGGTDKKDRR